MTRNIKSIDKTQGNKYKYSNTIFINGKSLNIDRPSRSKRLNKFIEDVI